MLEGFLTSRSGAGRHIGGRSTNIDYGEFLSTFSLMSEFHMILVGLPAQWSLVQTARVLPPEALKEAALKDHEYADILLPVWHLLHDLKNPSEGDKGGTERTCVKELYTAMAAHFKWGGFVNNLGLEGSAPFDQMLQCIINSITEDLQMKTFR